ncbi:2-iminoacetate synthase ThiH [Porphyromonas sp.]|uniref:2-iminoacetate synthase ThiH n=1 Tax=Porphyromonas sp. TaxID=1924944 RepID=UPI0026DD99AE|nr:2-iminoacetate synthase ThiH [Porphyromonas sp.]MDO4695301.1 2-iminoacetate synthase ThiH [Porphyromonas sp.]MDO4771036.1 2-iminoacetate synthase ThiH [Porphyromonas sp.]
MTFYDVLKEYNWDSEKASIFTKSEFDVRRALVSSSLNIEDFKALISPAAEPFLDEMAIKAEALTKKRFGKTIQLYVPLYLSNYCTNSCVYCGFNHANKIVRKKLSLEEVKLEAEAILKLGFKHILLVAGEAPQVAGIEYYLEVVKLLRPLFAQISIEVQPLKTEEYQRLVEAGVSYVCVYQETYNEVAYPIYHPRGVKSNFRFRLETPDRAAQGGIRKIGIGALLGLEDWRTDALCTAMHLRYLEKTYWRTKYSISLPRLRPHVGSFAPNDPISDKQLVQLICAYRLFDHQVDISLSTRESAKFRDMAMHIGATTMSAGSSTQPGGYVDHNKELEQFSINDDRSPSEMQAAVRAQGYEPVWKDWDEWM